MSNDFEKRLDWQIRDDILKLAEQVEVPAIEEQKEKFRRKYFDQNQTHSRNEQFEKGRLVNNTRLKWGVAAAVLLLAVAGFTISQPKTAEALGEGLLERIKIFLGGTLYNINDTRTREAPQVVVPDVDGREFFQEEETTLDAIREEVDFLLAEPSYLPEGCIFTKIYKQQGSNKFTVRMIYEFENTEIAFIQSKSIGDDSSSFMFDSDDTAVEKVMINGEEGYISQLKDGQTSIKWVLRGLELRLVSTLNNDELLKIANSVK